jgi:serine/threonine-protein kinase
VTTLRLITFGGVSLDREHTPLAGAVTGQRRLALLALLAAAGSRGISRDRLTALLWPDAGTEQARHSLDQALYAIRRALGGEALQGTSTLHLNSSIVETDIGEFDVAIQGRQLERAVSLYWGPFAHGLSISEATELEQHLDSVRARYAREHARALELLAVGATERGDHVAAADWWQRLSDTEPLSGRIAKERIASLAAAGENAKALAFATLHARFVEQETGARPTPEISQWVRRLQAGESAPVSREAPAISRSRESAVDTEDQRRFTALVRALGQRYRVSRLLDEGTATAIYAARREEGGSSHEVEIHVVQPRIAAVVSPEHFVSTLTRAIALADPSVLPVLDVGAAADVLFFVTSCRLAANLRDRLRREGALPIPAALSIIRGIASAVAHAHERGLSHGDLRPKHVELTGTTPVVSGFGFLEAVVGKSAREGRSTIVSLGSRAYQSPEQITGAATSDARSDVYAVGAMAYEILIGTAPFADPANPATLGRKLTEPAPSLRPLRETVPQWLDDIVMHCLARQPADRFASGAELARALSE